MTSPSIGRGESCAPVEGTRIEYINLVRLVKPLIDRVRSAEQIALRAASLRKIGQLNEIVVTSHPDQAGDWIVVTGWTRTLAARSLAWPSLRAKIIEGADAVLLTSIAVADNTSRHDLCLFDQVQQACLLHRTTGESQTEVAKLMGYQPGTVSKLLRMGSLEPLIQEAMKDGRLVLEDGYNLAREHDPVKRMALFDRLLAGSIGKGEVGRHVTGKQVSKSTRLSVAGITITVPASADPVQYLADTSRKLAALVKAWKATGLPTTQFAAWLKEGDCHEAA
jgi:ParB-like chromosome segregation protein Spo0J